MYGPTVFPPLLPGVSTNRFSEGNALLVQRFLASNYGRFPGGVFCDMQAINDSEIEPGGFWRGLILVPHGVVYSIKPPPPNLLSVSSHFDSTLNLLSSLPQPPYGPRYPSGSWEYACLSVLNDARYQSALNFLTFYLSVKPSATEDVPNPRITQLKALSQSTSLLHDLIKQHLGNHGPLPLSYPLSDFLKNSALSAMKYHAMMSALSQGGESKEADLGFEKAKEIAKYVVGAYLRETVEGEDPQRNVFVEYFRVLKA